MILKLLLWLMLLWPPGARPFLKPIVHGANTFTRLIKRPPKPAPIVREPPLGLRYERPHEKLDGWREGPTIG